MWLHGNLDDWYNQEDRTVVRLPEEGRDSPTMFIFRSDRLAQSHLSQSSRILQYGCRLRSDYARLHIDRHDYRHNIEQLFFPMTERFRDEWGDDMVPVQLRILIKELGDHIGHIGAPLGWPDLYCVSKEGHYPPRGYQCGYFGRPW